MAEHLARGRARVRGRVRLRVSLRVWVRLRLRLRLRLRVRVFNHASSRRPQHTGSSRAACSPTTSAGWSYRHMASSTPASCTTSESSAPSPAASPPGAD